MPATAPLRLTISRDAACRLADFLQQPAARSVTKSNHWQYFSGQNHIEISRASGEISMRGGAGFDGDYLLNFRRPDVALEVRTFLRRLLGRDDLPRFVRAYHAVQDTEPHGGPALEEMMGRLPGPATAHKVLACYYMNKLSPHIAAKTDLHYLEIGPGTGYLAALFLLLRGGRCTIVDLPEIIPFSFLYLTKVFPDADFVLPHEIAGAGADKLRSRLVFTTPDLLNSLPDNSADVMVNTASFGEMVPEQIAAYFNFMRRVSAPDGLFFTANRVEKWMNRPGVAFENNVPGKGIPIRFAEYPWTANDRDIFQCASPFHAIVQPHNPIMLRLLHLAKH